MSGTNTFYNFEWPSSDVNSVYVTGTFDNWTKSTKLFKKMDGPGYIATIEIPNEKNYFKFVVDGSWVTNPTFKIEADSNGIENNVLYPEDLVRCHELNSPPCYKSESESSAFTTVSLSELNNEDEDEFNSDNELAASLQETLTRRMEGSKYSATDQDREVRYYSSMSLLSRFTRYFK